MTPLANALIAATPVDALLIRHVVSDYSADQIRESIADLVTAGNLPLAQALGEAGLFLYPQDENTLSMGALLANLRQDWVSAEGLLRELIEIQGDSATAFTYNMLVRSLRCQDLSFQALAEARHALELHPSDLELLSELADLESLFGTVAPT